MRIVVADESWIVSLEIQSQLEQAGHEVFTTVPQSNLLVALVSNFFPDLLILDLHPTQGAKAIDLADWAQDLGIPVVLMTTAKECPLARSASRGGIKVVDKITWSAELASAFPAVIARRGEAAAA